MLHRLCQMTAAAHPYRLPLCAASALPTCSGAGLEHINAMAPQVLIFSDAADMRAYSREQRRLGKTIGFVPTMVRYQPCMACRRRVAAALGCSL